MHSPLPTSLVHCGVATDGEEEFVGTAPEGDPTGVAVAFSQEEAAEAREVAEEVSNRGPFSFAGGTEHLQPVA